MSNTTDTTAARKLAAEAMERAERATPGPWYWNGYLRSRNLCLMGKGSLIVFDFVRWGMQAATIRFRDFAQCLMYPAKKWAKTHGVLDRMGTIEHPDAEFILSAREDVPALAAAVTALADEVEAYKVACGWMGQRLDVDGEIIFADGGTCRDCKANDTEYCEDKTLSCLDSYIAAVRAAREVER
jgi:hypothetical protein